MSLQQFVWVKLEGIETFILDRAVGDDATLGLAGRCQWVSLVSEVLPRGILAETGLSELLVGASGGGEFLLVLPEESMAQAEAILVDAAAGVDELSGGLLRLLWTSTENLGAWPLVRERLSSQMRQRVGTPGFAANHTARESDAAYFADFATRIAGTAAVGWSRATPARIEVESGERTFRLGDGPNEIALARHRAMGDDDVAPARLRDLANRAQGAKRWGLLRGDVDGFGVRLRNAASAEEYISLAGTMKQFLNGELRLLAMHGDFFRRVTLLWAGGDDFALYGSWDALIDFARELRRVFQRFAGDVWKDLPGKEGKTISMALAVAPQGANDAGASFRAVYEEAGRALEVAKSEDKDCFHLFGRSVEWKQLDRSSEWKATMIRMVREFRCSPDFLRELSGFYQDRLALPGRERTDRPWRYYTRISAALGDPRRHSAGFEKQKNALIRDLIGGGSKQARLKPNGRVAVDWARLELGV